MHNQSLLNKAIFWKFLKVAGISGLLFIAGSVVVLLILAMVFQDRIKDLFLENINKNLRTEIQVENISLNLIRNFPNASLTFSNTYIFEPGSLNKSDTLMEAGNIYLQFSLWDLIRKNYTVKQIEISRAHLRAAVSADGKPNYLIWETSQEERSKDFTILLKKIIFNQVQIEFDDQSTKTRISFTTEKFTMGGDFSENSFDLIAKGAILASEISVDNTAFLKNKSLELDLSLLVNNQTDFNFRKGLIRVNNHNFSVLGKINTSSPGTLFDIQVAGRDLLLQDLIKDLPETFKSYTKDYRSKGNLVFDATIKGLFSSSQNPHVEASFNISGAEVNYVPSSLQLKGLSLSGKFNNGDKCNFSTSTLSFSDFYTSINDGYIKGNFVIQNFNKPYLDLKLISDSDLGDLSKLLRIKDLSSASGSVQTDFAFKGHMSQKNKFTKGDFLQARASGSISLKNGSFRITGSPLEYNEFNGSFLFNNTDLIVEDFSGKVSSSDFKLKGSFRNVLPYLFLENQKIFIDANLYSHNLNFDEMLKEGIQETDTTYQLQFSDRLGFNLEVNIVNLKFRKFEAQHLMGNANLQDRRFYAGNLSFRSMEGKIQANAFIDGTRSDYLTFGCDAKLQQVDIHKLFYQMNNFGQTSIKDDNIFGAITSDFSFNARWSPTLDVDWSSLETTADIKVENGALVNYQPMIELSRFLKVADLNHVTFSTLENQIHIKNRKIIIPEMEIKSSALDLKLTGEHTFENAISYRLQVLLSDLLARENRKSRNPQEKYGDIIDDGLGRTTLFLAITGSIDEPIFKYDYQGVREKLQSDLRKEGQTLKEVFRAEFGGPEKEPNDSTLSPARKRKELIKKQEEGEFIIEWEENEY